MSKSDQWVAKFGEKYVGQYEGGKRTTTSQLEKAHIYKSRKAAMTAIHQLCKHHSTWKDYARVVQFDVERDRRIAESVAAIDNWVAQADKAALDKQLIERITGQNEDLDAAIDKGAQDLSSLAEEPAKVNGAIPPYTVRLIEEVEDAVQLVGQTITLVDQRNVLVLAVMLTPSSLCLLVEDDSGDVQEVDYWMAVNAN